MAEMEVFFEFFSPLIGREAGNKPDGKGGEAYGLDNPHFGCSAPE